MSRNRVEGDDASLNEETRRIWNRIAEWWDGRIGQGNQFQNQLIEPASEKLLAVQNGDLILDIACGAGRFTRRLADLGARVVAFDFSENFIRIAKMKALREKKDIEWHVIDATDEEQMVSLGQNRFDKAVCTMGLMDIALIDPLFSALSVCLKKNGHFVFSVTHPCFHSNAAEKYCELAEYGDRPAIRKGVKVSKYRDPFSYKGIGIVGQPEPQYYFHRSLETLLSAGFKTGFVVDGFLESCFSPSETAAGPSLRWQDMSEIPPILVVRMRLLDSH